MPAEWTLAVATSRLARPMPNRLAKISGTKEILLVKRRGTRNLRLSVSSSGQIRVGMPYYLPYAAGLAFAKRHAEWIAKQQLKYQQPLLQSGQLIGRTHRLEFIIDPAAGERIYTRVAGNAIRIRSGLPFNHKQLQQKALAACERALKAEADTVLAIRLKTLAERHGYSYTRLRIRKLSSRWGSCSSAGNITLSIFLVQLPSELIDYVILHELVHTRHLNHGPGYWEELTKIMPGTPGLRKELKRHNPRIEPA